MRPTLQLLITADNHLDPSAIAFGHRRMERKADHMRCFEEAMEYAAANKPDLILLGGDVFDSLRPSNLVRAMVMEWFRRLHSLGIHILAVSGHHDTPKSLDDVVSPLTVYGSSGYIHYFQNIEGLEHRTIPAKEVEVTVYGLSSNPVGDQPVSLVHERIGSHYKIILLHHPIEGLTPTHGQPHVRLSDIPDDIQLVASGHLHKHQHIRVDGVTILYPGSTERCSFNEELEEKGFVWAEISWDGEVSLEHLRTSARPFKTVEMNVPEDGILEAINHVLQLHADRDIVFRLSLKGRVSPEVMMGYRRSEILLEYRDKFFHLVVDDSELEFTIPARLAKPSTTTPLQEVRMYFQRLIDEGRYDRALVDEAARLTLSMLEAEDTW